MSPNCQQIDEYKNMRNFKKILDANLQDIEVVEWGPMEENCMAWWSKLDCLNCDTYFESDEDFFHHTLKCEICDEEAADYYKRKIVSISMEHVLDAAACRRVTRSLLVKSMNDDCNLKLFVPLSSPLAIYIAEGMNVWCNTLLKKDERLVRANITSGGITYHLQFADRYVEPDHEPLAIKKETEEIQFIDFDSISIPDIVLDASTRTNEETRLLAKALGFTGKKIVSQEAIMKKIKKKFKKKV